MGGKEPFREGAIGAAIEFQVKKDGRPEDMSAATVSRFTFRTPAGELLGPFDVDFLTDGTDGVFAYFTPDAEFFGPARVGRWEYELYLELPGFKGACDPAHFHVEPRLRATA